MSILATIGANARAGVEQIENAHKGSIILMDTPMPTFEPFHDYAVRYQMIRPGTGFICLSRRWNPARIALWFALTMLGHTGSTVTVDIGHNTFDPNPAPEGKVIVGNFGQR